MDLATMVLLVRQQGDAPGAVQVIGAAQLDKAAGVNGTALRVLRVRVGKPACGKGDAT
ncbi:MAG TPA: hypothetical protein VGS79_18550 [Puia sp.]|nr:hypothetical protein [Puia sp.]